MKKIVTVLIFAMCIQGLQSQDFQGEATYKTQRKIDIQLDSTQVNSGQYEQMIAMVKKQFQKTYILSFNKEASIYKEDKQLESPQPAGDQIIIINTGGSDVLYKNLKENRFTNQNESFSKLFLIKDELKKHDWELTGDKKFIGEYECYKATMTREVKDVQSRMSINRDKDLEEDADEEPKMKEITITAWYTPQIPINNGPENYHGLPGLILEINDGRTTMICSKIVINPKKKINIVEPKKGKEISQEDYDAVMNKKMKEMEERMRSNWNSDGGETIEIRIGG